MAPADAGAIFYDAKLFRIKFNDIQQDLGGLVHPLDGGAFADAVEVETAGAEVVLVIACFHAEGGRNEKCFVYCI